MSAPPLISASAIHLNSKDPGAAGTGALVVRGFKINCNECGRGAGLRQTPAVAAGSRVWRGGRERLPAALPRGRVNSPGIAPAAARPFWMLPNWDDWLWPGPAPYGVCRKA